MFKENFDNFMILSIFANTNIRFERLKKRMREDDSQDFNEFKKRDMSELGFGIGSVISLSDRLIINESDMESFIQDINDFFDEIGL
jgi:dephospho-CoA kinase